MAILKLKPWFGAAKGQLSGFKHEQLRGNSAAFPVMPMTLEPVERSRVALAHAFFLAGGGG